MPTEFARPGWSPQGEAAQAEAIMYAVRIAEDSLNEVAQRQLAMFPDNDKKLELVNLVVNAQASIDAFRKKETEAAIANLKAQHEDAVKQLRGLRDDVGLLELQEKDLYKQMQMEAENVNLQSYNVRRAKNSKPDRTGLKHEFAEWERWVSQEVAKSDEIVKRLNALKVEYATLQGKLTPLKKQLQEVTAQEAAIHNNLEAFKSRNPKQQIKSALFRLKERAIYLEQLLEQLNHTAFKSNGVGLQDKNGMTV